LLSSRSRDDRNIRGFERNSRPSRVTVDASPPTHPPTLGGDVGALVRDVFPLPWYERSAMPGRLRALYILAVALLRALFLRAFGSSRGLSSFEESYREDRLPPLTPEERAGLPELSGCIACGLCNEGEGERMAASGGAYPGLMQIVLASSRNMPDFDAAKLALHHVPDSVLSEKERICPTGVPFRRMAAFVRAKGA
jgi:hypothetical protein